MGVLNVVYVYRGMSTRLDTAVIMIMKRGSIISANEILNQKIYRFNNIIILEIQ